MDYGEKVMNNAPKNMVWFTGVVESRVDPLQCGRCKVRCFGYHSRNVKVLTTEELPWALVGDGIKLKEGDWVFGTFLDGELAQSPLVMLKFTGIPIIAAEDESIDHGFHDRGVDKTTRPFPPKELEYSADGNAVTITEGEADLYPAKTEAYLKQSIEEPDTPRLARSDEFENENTAVEKRDSFVETGVITSNGVEWNEPKSQYNAVYPYNRVLQTESGHSIEIDDTPGAERLAIQHRSGSFVEIHPNGDAVLKFLNNRYTIVAVDDNIIIHGNSNLTVDKNKNVLIKKNRDVEITENDDLKIQKNRTTSIEIDDTTNVNGNSTINIKKSETRAIELDKTENVKGNSAFTGKVIRLN